MSGTKATENYNADKSELRKLTHHENEDVRLAAKVVLKYRYGEEVSL